MARITTWVNASLVAAAATVTTVGFIDAAGMNDAPTVAECVEDWNARAGEDLQAQVAAESYGAATVNGWFHDFAGCGVAFTPRRDASFLTCTRSFDASDPAGTDWMCEWDFARRGATAPVGSSGVQVVSSWQLDRSPSLHLFSSEPGRAPRCGLDKLTMFA